MGKVTIPSDFNLSFEITPIGIVKELFLKPALYSKRARQLSRTWYLVPSQY
jgi:hypothetical protein